VNKGAKTATITQNRTIANPTVAILDENRMERPAHRRLETPTFLSTFIGAVGCSAVGIVTPLLDKPEIRNKKSETNSKS
jgi:hypothetical protein